MSKKRNTTEATNDEATNTEYTMGLTAFQPKARQSKAVHYPVDQLTKGEGFFHPLEGKKLGSIRQRLNILGKRYGKKLKTAVGTVDGVEGLAVSLAAE